jgi:hypothetical protein
MVSHVRRSLIASLISVSGLLGVPQAQEGQPHVNPDARTLVEFQERLKAYIDIHQKAERALPSLPKEATPEQIDHNQRELGRLIRESRPNSRQGDIFFPDMQELVRRLLKTTFGSPQKAAQLRASIMDENPVGIKIAVNGRYPDQVPLATMPPEILKTLPKMPEELEYRFVSDNMIILDVHAHLIVDYVADVLPR